MSIFAQGYSGCMLGDMFGAHILEASLGSDLGRMRQGCAPGHALGTSSWRTLCGMLRGLLAKFPTGKLSTNIYEITY